MSINTNVITEEKKSIKQEMLGKVDIELFEETIEYATYKSNTNVMPLLRQWQEGKKDIYKMFDNKFTIEKKFSGSLNSDEIHGKKHNFLATISNSFTEDEINRICDVFYYCNLSNEEIINNRISSNFSEKKAVGMKLSKYLRSLIEEEKNFIEINEKMKSKREFFDIEFSKFHQSLFFEGVLVLSIDPLDYLTMSRNNNNWSSCHDFDGCHKGGVLSYLIDPSTVIAFVKSKNDKNNTSLRIFDGVIKWNNKKWRQVVHVDIKNKSAIFARHYPGNNEVAEKEAREVLNKQFAKFLGIKDKWKICKNGEAYISIYESLHFNDIGNENGYTRTILETGNIPNVVVGGIPICPSCGHEKIYDSNFLMCSSCDHRIFCACCEEYYHEDDMMRRGDDSYCNSCFNEYFYECEDCEESFPLDDIYIITVNGNYINVCYDCRSEYDTCNNCEDHVHSNESFEVGCEYFCENCYNEIIGECENCNIEMLVDNLIEYKWNYYCQECCDEIVNKEIEEEKEEELEEDELSQEERRTA